MRKVVHPDFPEYFVRDDGLVERRFDSRKYQKAGSVLYGRVLASGYRQFKLVGNDGKPYLVRDNRLVAIAFHGPAPTKTHQSAHKNGDRLDNRPENLYWATPKQNKRDAIRHGTAVHGEAVVNQHGPAKITREIVMDIRADYTGTRGEITQLARKYGVYPTCIQKILSGETWRHVPGRSALDIKRAA